MFEKLKSVNKKLIGSFFVLVALTVILGAEVFAWFYISRVTRSDDLEIDIPPIIYVKDDNVRQMTSFGLDGLQVDEEYTTVFCVSPAYLNAVHSYELAVIYTENMGMDIELYPIEEISAAASDPGDNYEDIVRSIGDAEAKAEIHFTYNKQFDWGESRKVTYNGWESDDSSTSGIINRGVYKKYSNMKFDTSYTESDTGILNTLKDGRWYKFYALKITWKETDADIKKEADIVYIAANGTNDGSGE